MNEIPMVSSRQILTALRQTPAGESLTTLYRWSFFRKQESNDDWRDVLGATAIDFSHGQVMYGVGRTFLSHEQGRFTPEREKTFLLGLLTHDFGEATVEGIESVGDVPAIFKTSDDERKESVVAREVIRRLDVDDETRASLWFAYEQVVEGKDQELHDAFRALERTEYLMTALKVFQNGNRRRAEGKEGIQQERLLVGRVLVKDIPVILTEYVPQYPDSIGMYLKTVAPIIDEAYAATKSKLVEEGVPTETFEAAWQRFKDYT